MASKPTAPSPISLSLETRYALADMLAKTFKISPEVITLNRNYYFREVINAEFRIKGEVATLSSRYDNDTATHTTNLILAKLATPAIVRTSASIDGEEF